MSVVGVVSGCSGVDPTAASVHGRVWRHRASDLALHFEAPWRIAVRPEHFRSGQPGVVLEGSRAPEGEAAVQLVIAWHPLPGGETVAMWLGRPSSLDLLQRFGALPASVRGHPAYRLERLPHCGDVVERRFVDPETELRVTQHAVAGRGGLLMVHGWLDTTAAPARDADPVRAALRTLTCGRRDG